MSGMQRTANKVSWGPRCSSREAAAHIYIERWKWGGLTEKGGHSINVNMLEIEDEILLKKIVQEEKKLTNTQGRKRELY